jgi:hypothetical protein
MGVLLGEDDSTLERWIYESVESARTFRDAPKRTKDGRNHVRVLTIFEALVFRLFEADFPFRFPHAVRENGKRKWELGGCRWVVRR